MRLIQRQGRAFCLLYIQMGLNENRSEISNSNNSFRFGVEMNFQFK